MLLNSISHIVCKFQKDWLINKKKAKFDDGPLKRLPMFDGTRRSLYFYDFNSESWVSPDRMLS